MSLLDMLTRQIVLGEITVEQAQGSILAYYHRKARPKAVATGLGALRQERPVIKEGEISDHFETLAEAEDRAIDVALEHNENELVAAAKELGIGRSTLYRKLKARAATAR